MRRKKDGLDHQLKQNRQWRKKTGQKPTRQRAIKQRSTKEKVSDRVARESKRMSQNEAVNSPPRLVN